MLRSAHERRSRTNGRRRDPSPPLHPGPRGDGGSSRLISILRGELPRDPETEHRGRLASIRAMRKECRRGQGAAHDATATANPFSGGITDSARWRPVSLCRHPDRSALSGTGPPQFHHDVPFARGGPHSVDNVRMLCAMHNAHMARRDYGAEHIQAAIDAKTVAKKGTNSPRGRSLSCANRDGLWPPSSRCRCDGQPLPAPCIAAVTARRVTHADKPSTTASGPTLIMHRDAP